MHGRGGGLTVFVRVLNTSTEDCDVPTKTCFPVGSNSAVLKSAGLVFPVLVSEQVFRIYGRQDAPWAIILHVVISLGFGDQFE
jgi:hypothetical protein